jgi:hypothetical protein
MAAGRTLDAGLHLLDRQLVDCDGRLAGNVDDLELELPDDGGPPVIVAIISGPGALAERIGGRLGHGWAALHRRLRPGGEAGAVPDPVSFAVVKRIGSQIDLSISVRELDSYASERWVRDHIIGKIPGAHHADE